MIEGQAKNVCILRALRVVVGDGVEYRRRAPPLSAMRKVSGFLSFLTKLLQKKSKF